MTQAIERSEVIVICAGLSGMYQLIRLRELGFNVRAYEAGDGVGGIWYWNRYPGVRFDSPATWSRSRAVANCTRVDLHIE